MPKKNKIDVEKEEEEYFEESLKKAEEESQKPEQNGKTPGIAGIIIGILGLFLPYFLTIIFGVIAAILGIYANQHGKRKLGIACGIIALLDLLLFLIFQVGKFPF